MGPEPKPATLVRTFQSRPYAWPEPLTYYVFRADDGEWTASEMVTPSDCTTIGQQVKLQYQWVGNGYSWVPSVA